VKTARMFIISIWQRTSEIGTPRSVCTYTRVGVFKLWAESGYLAACSASRLFFSFSNRNIWRCAPGATFARPLYIIRNDTPEV
jgi:hypothetical protein